MSVCIFEKDKNMEYYNYETLCLREFLKQVDLLWKNRLSYSYYTFFSVFIKKKHEGLNSGLMSFL